MLKDSQLRSPWSDLAEFRTHSSSFVCSRSLQVWENSGDNVWTTFLSIQSLWELSVVLVTRVLLQNLLRAIPYHNYASNKALIASGLLVSEIYMFERVDARTDSRTDAGLTTILYAHIVNLRLR